MKRTTFFYIVAGLILLGVTFFIYKGIEAVAPEVEETEGVEPSYLSAYDLPSKVYEIRTYARNIELETVDSFKVKFGNFPEKTILKTSKVVKFDTISVPVFKEGQKGKLVERWDLIDSSAYSTDTHVFAGLFGEPLWLTRRKRIVK